MKKIIRISANVAVLLLLTGIFSCQSIFFPKVHHSVPDDIINPNPGSDPVVHFPDENLKKLIWGLINTEINQDVIGDIHQSDLLNLTVIPGSSLKIADLTGLEYCSNLNELNIPYNQIISLNPLTELKNLEILYVHDNNSESMDLTPLAGLDKLKKLYLHNNKSLTNPNSLSGLINLEELVISNDNLSDLTMLSKCSKLTKLFLDNNLITDFSFITDLNNLVELNLNQTNLAGSIKNLTNLIKINKLYLSDCNLTDISSLAKLVNITNINLSHNNITDISVLKRIFDDKVIQLLPTKFTVDIRYNNLDITTSSQVMEVINYLKSQGVIVLYTPQN